MSTTTFVPYVLESKSDKTDNAVHSSVPDNKPALSPVQDTAGVDGEQADKINPTSTENSEGRFELSHHIITDNTSD